MLRPQASKETGISFFSRLMGKQTGGNDTEVYLGAFGKHVGWNDHIDDPGLETQRLVDFKTLVYVEGIAPNIEAGKWDKLEPDARIEGFAHVLLMRSRGDLLIARIWSSRDGKGRDKYPMGVAAQLHGASLEWALGTVLPELESVQQRCEQATTAEQVISILDSARCTLRARLASVASERDDAPAELLIPQGYLAAVADRPDMGPSRQGLYRILYQLHREAEMFEQGSKPQSRIGSMGGKGAEASHLTSVQLRLPAIASAGAAANDVVGVIRGAEQLLLSRLEPWATTLLIVRSRGGTGDGVGGGGNGPRFVDAIIGEPQGPQFFALQASEKTVPLTTEIPYTIDAAFARQADGWIASKSADGDQVVPMPPESARRSGAGRFLALALIAAAGMMGGVSRQAFAEQPPVPIATQAEPRLSYNQALSELKIAVMNSQTPDTESSAAAKKFLADVRALPGGIAFLGSVQSTLQIIETAMTNSDAGSVPAEVLARGPGSAPGYVGSQDGKLVRFKPSAGGGALPELAFVRVDMPGGDAVLLGATEVSAAQFAAIVSVRAGPNELVKSLRQFDRVSDPRPGPRCWEWIDSTGKRGGVRAPHAWLASRALGSPDDYPKDAEPAAPTLDAPMQHLSPSAALLGARLVGCRLPTSAEWAAAKAQFPASGTPANLRDSTWKAQFSFSQAQRAAGGKNQLPDAGAFVPPGATPSPSGASLDVSDGTLWFTPVFLGQGDGLKNLVGNVAEFVLDVPVSDEPEARPGAASAFIAENASKLHIIGGSALSDPAIPVDQPQPVVLEEAQEGYADVGFRLCFSAGFEGGQSLAARLNRLLEPLPTLPVRK